MQLGQSIDTRRSALLVFLAGHVIWISAKDVISRNMNQQSIALLHDLGEILRSSGIQRLAKFGVRLRLIDIRLGRTVDDDIHPFGFT